MAGIINPYFHKSPTIEQDLANKLIVESIQVMGRMYYYMPRTVMEYDGILHEEISSRFDAAIPIEMYMQTVEGFQGNKEIFSKFGLEIQNTFVLVMSQTRFQEGVLSVSVRKDPTHPTKNIIRPLEGDVVYDPLTRHLYEIKNVDIDDEFFQIGKNYMYHITCEQFQYNSEPIATGVADIDQFNNDSFDTLAGADKSKATRDYGTDFKTPAAQIGFDIQDPFSEK